MRFAWPRSADEAGVTGQREETSPGESDYREMQVIGESELSTNDVTYINGEFNLIKTSPSSSSSSSLEYTFKCKFYFNPLDLFLTIHHTSHSLSIDCYPCQIKLLLHLPSAIEKVARQTPRQTPVKLSASLCVHCK